MGQSPRQPVLGAEPTGACPECVAPASVKPRRELTAFILQLFYLLLPMVPWMIPGGGWGVGERHKWHQGPYRQLLRF